METLPGTIVHFSFVELEQATNKFSSANLVGLGGSSNVYRGQLQDGRVVAIKKLKLLGGPEADNDFLSEVVFKALCTHPLRIMMQVSCNLTSSNAC